MRNASDLQHFFSEDNFVHGCMAGECSLLSSFGPLVPRQSKALFEAGLAGDHKTMLELHQGFANMVNGVFGPLLLKDRVDGAYDKMIVRMAGLEDMPLRLLSPYQGFDEEEYQAAKRVFDEQYANWGV